MAALTLITDLALTTADVDSADGTPSNTSGGNPLLTTVYDDSNISSAVGMQDGSYTQHDLTSSDFAAGTPTKADLSYARAHSNSVRYGQIFPRTVYGN